MNYIEITSRNNDKIKYFNKLTVSVKERRESGLFVIEGARLCCDAQLSGYEISEVYITNDALVKYRQKTENLTENAQRVYIITDEVANKLSDTVNPQGVFCVVKMKRGRNTQIDSEGKYVALDNVQNPLNLGTVARTAEALGLNGIIVSSGCDVYNPKALRASMGSLLRIDVIETDSLAETLENARHGGMLTFATTPDSNAQDITKLDLSHGVVAVIGNEGNGVSQDIMAAAQTKVTIMMKGKAESMNASAAAVITMWEMMR